MHSGALSMATSRAPPGAVDLMRGRRHSVAGLRAALDEAQLRSLQNQKVLREAGERGQKLLSDEAALRQRLEECRSELRSGGLHAWLDEDDGEDGLSARTAGGSLASTSTVSSPLPARGSALGGLPAGAPHRLHPALQAEKQHLLEQNMLLTEELEEQERELASRPSRCGDPPLEEERVLAGARCAELAGEIDGETARAAAAERKRAQEHEALLQELSHAQSQACSMLGSLERQLEGAQARNASLRSELEGERALRNERAAGHREAVERLQSELGELQRGSEATEREVLQLEQRLAAQHEGPAEEAPDGEAGGEPPVAATASELLGCEWRSADDALREGQARARGRQGSLSSSASEIWDALSVSAVSEADAVSVASSRLGVRAERRRHRARASHCYRELAAPVTLRVSEADPGAASPPSWRKTLAGALW